MTPQTAVIVHDTFTIIDVDAATCEMFGYERRDLIDQRLTIGIYRGDMQWLAALRLKTIRELGELPPQDLPFYRANGSIFWARCKTTKRTDGLFETMIVYLYEY
jgi:PAS domain S-box-containing protein